MAKTRKTDMEKYIKRAIKLNGGKPTTLKGPGRFEMLLTIENWNKLLERNKESIASYLQRQKIA